MAEPHLPSPAKLFTGILYSHTEDLTAARNSLEEEFGSCDLATGPVDFSHTEYYHEMGPALRKVLLSFEGLIRREDLPDIKLFTNGLEAGLSAGGARRVNIDPGYMTLSNVFLASCKDFYHRVYAGKGVYVENEYRYTEGRYEFWPWTYPDYKKSEYLDFFYAVRKIYHRQIREERIQHGLSRFTK
jgi:hypothetical protein